MEQVSRAEGNPGQPLRGPEHVSSQSGEVAALGTEQDPSQEDVEARDARIHPTVNTQQARRLRTEVPVVAKKMGPRHCRLTDRAGR